MAAPTTATKPATASQPSSKHADKKTKGETIYTAEPLSKKPTAKIGGDKGVIHSKSTLFVSTLPFTSTATQLEDFFSSMGPIKSCFVVIKDGVHTGCGYVQYALAADALRAIVDLKKKKFGGVQGRTLKIVLAVKKSVVLEHKEGSNYVSNSSLTTKP